MKRWRVFSNPDFMNYKSELFALILITFCLYNICNGQEIDKLKTISSCDQIYREVPQISLYLAISDQNRECVKEYLNRKANPNFMLDSNIATAPISVALVKPDIDIIFALVKAGANLKGEDGYSALVTASANGYLDVVKLFIREGGTDVNGKSKFKPRFTPLSAASYYDKEEMVQFLLEAGAQVDDTTWDGVSSLMLAANNPNIINALLKAGAKVDLKDQKGWTALYHAINDNKPEKVEILLQHRAKVNIKDKNGLTPLKLAGQIENVKLKERIISILKEHGAK